jgi:hypothetical protein
MDTTMMIRLICGALAIVILVALVMRRKAREQNE